MSELQTPSGDSPDLLVVDGLVAGYGGSTVLHDVQFSIRRGEAVAVVGPNGAGKSTLLNTLSGIVHARRGTVRFDGTDVTNRTPRRIVQRGVIHVPEGRQVFPEMSVEENLRLGAFSKPAGARERFDAVLETFPRLRERLRQDAQTLSGGEQQMLAIGRGLMADPRLLMLDEPTLGLAPILVDGVLDRLQTIRQQFDTALLVVEQNAYLTRELCDRYYVLRNGAVVGSGDEMPDDPDELMNTFMGATAPSEGDVITTPKNQSHTDQGVSPT
jgi:branched-chain amino acid transport system ATP-binding protein